jgi:hypothetical protein
MKSSLHKTLFVLVIAAVLLAFPGVTRAQSTATHLAALEVDLWPEFDRAEMLVILKITLAQDVNLPAALEIRIPANATVWAVAEQQVTNLVTVAYEQRAEGDWKIISLTATVPEVQIEYYDPALTISNSSRRFEYNWPGGFTVDNLGMVVQQPFDASGMTINPSLGAGTVNQTDGLTYYSAQVGSLQTDQTFQATVDYQKASDKLSSESIQVQPAQPLGSNESGGASTNLPTNAIWLIVAGAVGLAMIIGGATWYIISSRKDSEPSPRRRRAATRTETAAASSDEAVYCQQCGKRAASGDRFCRQCGAKLRME